MTIPAQAAAKTLAVLRDWSVTNLELQKLVYISQMVFLGKYGQPLVNERFEAWDYGPVLPDLYHHLKGFGSSHIGNVFHGVSSIDAGSKEFEVLSEIVNQTREMSSAQLVAFTHQPDGAWAKYYTAGKKGIIIPNDSIAEEYAKRAA